MMLATAQPKAAAALATSLVLAAVFAGLVGAAQGAKNDVEIRTRPDSPPSREPSGRSAIIPVDVNLVLVNVTVTDPMGRLVTGLSREHFKVLEDKQEQKIVHFGGEDAPLSAAIVVDASGSMGEKMSKARDAVAQFVKTSNPQDEFVLIEFSNRPNVVSDFTSDPAEIRSQLTFVQSKGRTALLDAVYLALTKLREAKNAQKALLIISDGGDNSSRYTEREVRSLVRESEVQIYAIGIYEPFGMRSRTPEELAGPGLLTAIAEETGGRQFPVENIAELPDIAEKISIELRNQYVLGYTPQNDARDGKWRRLKVEIKDIRGLPELRPYFRSGYYAPSR